MKKMDWNFFLANWPIFLLRAGQVLMIAYLIYCTGNGIWCGLQEGSTIKYYLEIPGDYLVQLAMVSITKIDLNGDAKTKVEKIPFLQELRTYLFRPHGRGSN